MPTSEELQFGRLLLARNLVTREELAAALKEQERRRLSEGVAPRLGEVLVAMNLITELQVRQILAEQSGSAGGQKLGGYELLSRVGSGGMGTVYKARQTVLDRVVALKVLPQRLAKDSDFLVRFYREARAVAKLNHPNIVSGFDVGEADGYHYLAMEFVEGESAAALLAERPEGLPYAKVLDIAIQIGRALGHAHQNGLVHRDIKPENILIAKSGTSKLCDLGLARSTDREDASLTQAGMAVGTPHYISPEQARGEHDLDGRADIYSFGATLFHLATGRPVFTGDNSMQVMMSHLREPPPLACEVAPAVPAAFAAVINKMLAKRREDRYPTMEAVVEELQLVAAGKRPARAEVLARAPGAASGAAVGRRPPTRLISSGIMKAVAERRRRSPWPLVAGLAGLAALVALFAVTVGKPDREGPATAPTDPALRPSAPEPPRPEPPPPPRPVGSDDCDAALAYAREHPADWLGQIARLRDAIGKTPGESPSKRLARDMLAQAQEGRAQEVSKALEPIKQKAAERRAQRKFGAAAECFAHLPAEIRDELQAQTEAARAVDEIREAGLREWRGVLSEAQRLAAGGDFAAARRSVEAAREFGLPAVDAEIARQLKVLDEDEKGAAGRAHKEAAEAYAAFRPKFCACLAARRYAEAQGLADALARKTKLPADLSEKLSADRADLEALKAALALARKRVAKAKPDERFMVDGRNWRAQGVGDDGDTVRLVRLESGGLENVFAFRLSQLPAADVLSLAGLADGGGSREEARIYLLFSALDGSPAPEAVRRAISIAKRWGVDTARFEARLSQAEAEAREREATQLCARLEELVKAKQWDEAAGVGRSLLERGADTPTLKSRGAEVNAWIAQAREAVAARDRVEFVLQKGEPVPALGLAAYGWSADTTMLKSGGESPQGKAPGLTVMAAEEETARVLIRFDLPALPPGTSVESAKLELHCAALRPGTERLKLVVRRLTSDWQEGVGRWGKPDASDGASWLQRWRAASGEAASWRTPGGDIDTATDWGRGAGVVAEGEVGRQGEWVRLDVTAAVRDFVSGRPPSSGRLPNYGFLIEAPAAGGGGGATFVSGDAILGQTGLRPRLALSVTGLRLQPAPAPARIQDLTYVLTKAGDLRRFQQDATVGSAAGRPAAPVFKDEGLVLSAAGGPWRLEARRQWGWELEAAVKLDAGKESGARVTAEFGNALPDSRLEGLQLRASPLGVSSTFLPLKGPDRPPVPEALWVSSAGSAAANVWPENGQCDVRFVKRGPVLRLEAGGLCLAEVILSERDERELGSRPVRLLFIGGLRPTSAADVIVKEFRTGSIRPRPGPAGN